MIINDKGELLAFKLTLANVDDRKPVPDMTRDLIGKLFGDRGYISQKLFEELYKRGLELVTKSKKKMKNRLVKLIDKILLRKRAVIEREFDGTKKWQEVVQANLLGKCQSKVFWADRCKQPNQSSS
ncbi:MAG: transposase [Nostoc sp.]